METFSQPERTPGLPAPIEATVLNECLQTLGFDESHFVQPEEEAPAMRSRRPRM